MKTNGNKFHKLLWAGKNKEDGSIAFNWMQNSKKEALEIFDDKEQYEVVRVELREV